MIIIKIPDFSYKVKIHIEDEKEIYNKFNMNNTLSDDLVNYIQEQMELCATLQPIEFDVISSKKIDEDKFNTAFEQTIENQIKIINKQKRTNIKKEILMGTIGVLFIGLSIGLSSIMENQVILELISVIGSFSAWEAASSWLVVSRELRNKEKQLTKIDKGKITYKYM